MRALAVFELVRFLRRPASAIISVASLVVVILTALIAGASLVDLSASSAFFPSRIAGNTAAFVRAFLQAPEIVFSGRPNSLSEHLDSQIRLFAPAYSLLYTYYGLFLSLVGLTVGMAGTADARDAGSPMSALPVPASQRLAGHALGRAGLILIYHVLAWPAWGFFVLNGPFPVWGLLVGFLWPPALAAIFTLAGSLVRRIEEKMAGHGSLVAGLAPVLILGWLLAIAPMTADAAPLGMDPVTLAACPGLLDLLGSDRGVPIYLESATLLGLMALTTAGGLAFVLTRSSDVL